jgi:surface antigen Omp85-like protein
MTGIRRTVIGICVGIGLAVPAVAQQTREAERAAAQAEKAKQLHPYEPTELERRIQRIEKMFLNPPRVYVFIGSVYPGGFLAAGPGYRGRYAESGTFDVHSAWSLRNYKAVDALVKLPAFADGKGGVEVRANWLDAPQVAFYGLGNDTQRDDKTQFLYRATTVGASAHFKPFSILTVGGGMELLAIDTGAGRNGVSIERRFTSDTAPGLGASPTFAVTRFFADVDSRTSPGYTRRGGHYRVEWADHNDTSSGPYSFHRLDAEADQFIPLLRENWVIALRALVSTTDAGDAGAVPYFAMPTLGGSSQLRGFPSWRFRDRQRLLLTGEYRWMAGQYVDMALFVDGGKVAPRRADLDLHDLTTAYGIGARFHTPAATVMRIEVARTREGTSLVFGFGPVF